jgi:acyl transferase domain-containing protein
VDIAILGMGCCRLPGGADTPERFWSLLVEGVDAITEIPAERFDVEAVEASLPGGGPLTRWGGFVEELDAFDAAFFGISPREARRIDPQQRLFLEVVADVVGESEPVLVLGLTVTPLGPARSYFGEERIPIEVAGPDA